VGDLVKEWKELMKKKPPEISFHDWSMAVYRWSKRAADRLERYEAALSQLAQWDQGAVLSQVDSVWAAEISREALK
jgi:hypothetical protein